MKRKLSLFMSVMMLMNGSYVLAKAKELPKAGTFGFDKTTQGNKRSPREIQIDANAILDKCEAILISIEGLKSGENVQTVNNQAGLYNESVAYQESADSLMDKAIRYKEKIVLNSYQYNNTLIKAQSSYQQFSAISAMVDDSFIHDKYISLRETVVDMKEEIELKICMNYYNVLLETEKRMKTFHGENLVDEAITAREVMQTNFDNMNLPVDDVTIHQSLSSGSRGRSNSSSQPNTGDSSASGNGGSGSNTGNNGGMSGGGDSPNTGNNGGMCSVEFVNPSQESLLIPGSNGPQLVFSNGYQPLHEMQTPAKQLGLSKMPTYRC